MTYGCKAFSFKLFVKKTLMLGKNFINMPLIYHKTKGGTHLRRGNQITTRTIIYILRPLENDEIFMRAIHVPYNNSTLCHTDVFSAMLSPS